MNKTFASQGIDRHRLTIGLLLVGLFFVPDVWADAVVLPIQAASLGFGWSVVAHLVPALAGSVLLIAALVDRMSPYRNKIAILSAMGGISGLVLSPINHLPMQPVWVLATLSGAVLLGGWQKRRGMALWGVRLIIGVPPILFLSWNISLIFLGPLSASYLTAFKIPIQIYLLLDAAFANRSNPVF